MIPMRCAAEEGWPRREFVPIGAWTENYSVRHVAAYDYEVRDHVCTTCGWHQTSFAEGCRELVMEAVWHDANLLAAHVAEARKTGRPLSCEVDLDVPPATTPTEGKDA